LAEFEAIYPLPGENQDDLDLFLARIGRRDPSPAAQQVLGQLDEHWDRVAEIIREGSISAQPMLGRFWQFLPGMLEAASEQAALQQVGSERAASEQMVRKDSEKCALDYAAVQRRYIDELESRLARASAEMTALHNSRSFRITAPLRHISRRLRVYKNME
jgi:hypothetical protein